MKKAESQFPYVSSYEVTHWSLRTSLPSLEKLVLAVLCDHRNSGTGICFMKTATLVTRTGLCIQSVRKYIALLEQRGMVRVIKPKSEGNPHKCNAYDFPRLNELAKSKCDLIEKGESDTLTKKVIYSKVLPLFGSEKSDSKPKKAFPKKAPTTPIILTKFKVKADADSQVVSVTIS